MIYSPLKFNQVIYPSNEIAVQVLELSSGVNADKRENFCVGLCAEYSHNEEFEKAKIPIILTAITNPYDRIVDGLMQDDKVATMTFHEESQKSFLTTSHTVSINEYLTWKQSVKNGKDVIIHSFEQIELNSLGVRYKGALSFKAIDGYFNESKDGKTMYFNRALAYKWARLN